MPNAASILERYWDGKLPVDPKRIGSAMGVAFRANPFLGVSGAVSLVFGKPVVEYNSTEAPVRQRFTIAHEIGHFALGHMSDGAKMFRDPASNFSSSSSDRREREANAFAAQMLMPAETLRYAVTEKRIVDVERLAKLFGVSQAAMGFRLNNLGLVHV